MFYNTGIATYVRVLTNRKPEHRKGKVQLVDATGWFKPLRKNLGKKNCELTAEDIHRIVDTFLTFEASEHSKIFPNAAFGYEKITVERPLRLSMDLSEPALAHFRKICAENGEAPLVGLMNRVAEKLGSGPHREWNAFLETVEGEAKREGVKLLDKHRKLLRAALARRDEAAAPVIKKVEKLGGAEPDPLYGRHDATVGGRFCVVEYEPDPELRDTEQVPLLEEGGVEAFVKREVLPHAPDAWIAAGSARVGYEINFNRHFYKPLRTLEEIRADIDALEKETEGLLEQILVETEGAR